MPMAVDRVPRTSVEFGEDGFFRVDEPGRGIGTGLLRVGGARRWCPQDLAEHPQPAR